MNLTTGRKGWWNGLPGEQRRKLLVGALFAAAGVVSVSAIGLLLGSLGSPDETLVYHTVERGSLPIIVTERGNLESQDDIKVRCEVEDIHGDGVSGTQIISIVPNGTSVKEGDLLVELDESGHQERLDRQILDTERARSEKIQASVKYENQKTQNATNLAEAKLKVDLAELALKQFEDEEGGTFQIELQNVELTIQEAQAAKLIEETNLQGVEQLYKLGYRSSGELDQARLSALRAERQLATAMSKKKELVEYQYRKSKLELEGQVASAKRSLEQVERDNEALLAQARAATEAADEAFKKEEERLGRYKEQVAKCKIYAPADGMVAYAVSRSRYRREDIRTGVSVYPRQTILSLPNLQKMQVKTAVHESVLDEVAPGLPTTVRVDAFPEREYRGSVLSVAVLPDQDSWMGSDTKVYETVVTIDEEVDQLKPGMTAVVEIEVDDLRDVLSVPVQAVEEIGTAAWCWADSGEGGGWRRVETGRTNHKFVQIKSGLQEGDRVALNLDDITERPPEEDPAGEADEKDDEKDGEGRSDLVKEPREGSPPSRPGRERFSQGRPAREEISRGGPGDENRRSRSRDSADGESSGSRSGESGRARMRPMGATGETPFRLEGREGSRSRGKGSRSREPGPTSGDDRRSRPRGESRGGPRPSGRGSPSQN